MAAVAKHELEFLPATLEVQETPPSPIGRAITWAIIGLFSIAIAWACFGKVDIVAVAQGKIVPSDRVKVIQPLEIGTIRAIRVKDGQRVNAGDTLIELDTTVSAADQNQIEQDLSYAQLDGERLDALLQRANGQAIVNSAGTLVTDAATTVQELMLEQEWREYRARLAAADQAIATRTAELATARSVQERLVETLPLITQRSEALKKLADKQFVATQQYLELEQQRIEAVKTLESERHHITQLQAAIRQANEERLALQAEFKGTTLSELAKAQQRTSTLQQELTKANQRTALQKLVAPINGVVQQLAVHTIGGVVTPAQELLRIVPLEDHLEVEAFLENKDIGFVKETQIYSFNPPHQR